MNNYLLRLNDLIKNHRLYTNEVVEQFHQKHTHLNTISMQKTEKITKMLKTQKLTLSFWQRLDYFRSVYVVVIVGAMLWIPMLLLKVTSGYFVVTILTTLIAYFLFRRLKTGLFFKEIRTNLSQNENYIKIRNTFEAMNVEMDTSGMDWLVGYVNKLWKYSGERISVINTDGYIYVNSISPRGGLRFRTNRQNVEIFEQYFYRE